MAAIPSDELIRETMQEVLRRPEFVETSNQPWHVEVVRWVLDLSERLARWQGEHPVQGWLLLGVLLVVLIGLLTHLFYVAFGDLLFGTRGTGGRPAATPWSILEGTAANWQKGLAKARQGLAAGNVRLAVWITHRVLLGLLDERATIRFAHGKTNTDYVRECPADHPWQTVLVQLTALYDRVIYAQQPVAPATVEHLLGQVEAFQASPAHDQ